MKARFVQELHSEPHRVQHLYEVEPGGSLPQFVVVSAVVVSCSGAETFIFAANEHGDITNFGGLVGSFEGDLDIPRALRQAGYEVAP